MSQYSIVYIIPDTCPLTHLASSIPARSLISARIDSWDRPNAGKASTYIHVLYYGYNHVCQCIQYSVCNNVY